MPFDRNDPANIECLCCQGKRVLLVYSPDAAIDGTPPVEMICCHCSGSGVIPPDMRSDNAYE